jgi:outer membrane protein assembly factor BamD
LSLGIAAEAQNAVAVLGYNFPNSSWYKDSYALLKKQGLMPEHSAGSWMAKVMKGPAGQPPAVQPAAEPPPAAPPAWPTPSTKPETPPGPPPPSTLGGPAS